MSRVTTWMESTERFGHCAYNHCSKPVVDGELELCAYHSSIAWEYLHTPATLLPLPEREDAARRKRASRARRTDAG